MCTDDNESQSFLQVCKGDGCMKDTVHPTRHPRVHLGDPASAPRRRTCARRNGDSGRGQNTVLGGSDPTFGGFQPPKPKWGRSRPSRRKRDRVLAACRKPRMQGVRQNVRQSQRGGRDEQHGDHQGTTQTTKVGDGSSASRGVRENAA